MASSTGLLVVSNIKHLGKSLRAIEKYVNSLYIHLNVAGSTSTTSPVPPTPVWGRLISQLYANSSSYVGNQLDLRVLVSPLRPGASGSLKLRQPVDLIFSDAHHPELCDRLRADLNITKPTIFLEDTTTSDLSDQQDATQAPKVYPSVVLGGTFDRIHLGHKIFLTQAVLRTCKRLVVGVTSAAMTKGKTLPDLILPVEERIARLREFLMDIDGTLQYEIVPIDDPFGPTQVDPDLDMIVVSAETLRGGQKVNEIRKAKQLRELEIFVIDIVESNVHDGIHETKVSSSNTRIDLLGSRWRRPEQRTQLPARPHIIGLTGGIASGKSKMAERLGNMGAHVIDCDKVAHDVYEPGQVCYQRIVQHFGQGIVSAADGRIDRTKLGPLVFADPKELQALNGIVWPELIAEVNRRLDKLRSQADVPRVVVLEAAVLLRAGWEINCHEVWSMIVPPEEAVRRIVERNNLSEEEAKKRLASQVPNREIVAKSHVIFSSQWDHDFTQKQAERAWHMLTKELDSHQSSL
ncbi:hypothetical protein KR084_003452 [Drosophila pseudotakahashii]|nr:hypothetical protein KR084_003452 [Drosophila pseudotakahashii]